MFNPFKNKPDLSQEEIIRKRTNTIITVSFSILAAVMFALFNFKIHNEALAMLCIATFAAIVITSIIADYDEVKIGPIEIKRSKKVNKDE